MAAESATTRLVKPGCRFCQWESGAGRVGGGWGRVALRLAVLRACLQNQLGGTGLRPVVSGDSPETAVGRRLALVSAANQQWTATDDIRRDARFDGRGRSCRCETGSARVPRACSGGAPAPCAGSHRARVNTGHRTKRASEARRCRSARYTAVTKLWVLRHFLHS